MTTIRRARRWHGLNAAQALSANSVWPARELHMSGVRNMWVPSFQRRMYRALARGLRAQRRGSRRPASTSRD
eukprot:1526222-Pleurochrysis_carterae.AAC.4